MNKTFKTGRRGDASTNVTGLNNLKKINMETTNGNQPQLLIMVDEATLYTMLKEIVSDALKEARAETPKPYTRAEVMKLLNVKATALWNMQQKGILHPIRTCKKLLFDRSEVDALIKKH